MSSTSLVSPSQLQLDIAAVSCHDLLSQVSTQLQLDRSDVSCHLLLPADVCSIVKPIRSQLSFSQTYRTLDNIAGTESFFLDKQGKNSSSCKLDGWVNIR